MNDEIYSDVTIERTIEASFGLKLNISEVVVREIPVGYTATATLFKTSPNMLYCFIQSQSNLVLADVRKILRNMNVDVEGYLPPHGDKEYFQRIGVEKFKTMFPGKHIMGDEDTRYYQTLAPYNPALMRVSRVKGDVRAFHIETKSWRKVKDYAFSRITL
jgi:hypothetical protein